MSFDEVLQSDLAELESNSLRRSLRQLDSGQGIRIRIGEREFLNFSSNDYWD